MPSSNPSSAFAVKGKAACRRASTYSPARQSTTTSRRGNRSANSTVREDAMCASSRPSARSVGHFAGLLVAYTSAPRSRASWMAAIPTPDAATKPAFYLLDLYRARIDPPTGMLSGVLMGKVKSGIEQGVAMNVKNAKARVEGK